MLAGFARILEVCFFAPSYAAETSDDDNNSEHTLADSTTPRNPSSAKAAASRSFRYLPPFLLVAAGLLFMSATDEELRFVKDNEWTTLAFLLYTFIVVLVNLYSTTGRNASKSANSVDDSNIEMVTPGGRSKWYSRVPLRGNGMQTHVLGDDDEDEDLMAPQLIGRR
ncbi:hypothetical protein BDZ97DRAFT_1925000 [Flammula alnicola]|nr:hypothetical protein BDZ97DRAFT_1925000 [Flammula alnicola]